MRSAPAIRPRLIQVLERKGVRSAAAARVQAKNSICSSRMKETDAVPTAPEVSPQIPGVHAQGVTIQRSVDASQRRWILPVTEPVSS